MKKENEELTPGEEELELEVTPGEQEKESVADTLTSKQLEATITKLVDEKVALAQTAKDDEEDEEEPEEEKSGFGLFPALLIAGVVIVGAATIFLQNRPISHPDEAQTRNDG